MLRQLGRYRCGGFACVSEASRLRAAARAGGAERCARLRVAPPCSLGGQGRKRQAGALAPFAPKERVREGEHASSFKLRGRGHAGGYPLRLTPARAHTHTHFDLSSPPPKLTALSLSFMPG